MADQNPLERLLLDNLPRVDRTTAVAARRLGLGVDETADLVGWVRLRFVEDDYQVLSQFRGESGIGTYLTIVITRMVRDHVIHERGRWRPSAAALRSGPIAVRLETLVYRAGHTLDQAVTIIQSGGETTLSEKELRALFSALPRREPMRPRAAGDEPLATVPGDSTADHHLVEREADVERRHVSALMHQWMAELPTEERLMLQMRFWQSMSVADIARALCMEQRPLYRQMERLLGRLRAALVECGITAQRFGELFGDAA